MTNRKSTKRALLGSVMAMVLCLAMLVGATFAWFTDTASTGVNKIQAGKLDVASGNEGCRWPVGLCRGQDAGLRQGCCGRAGSVGAGLHLYPAGAACRQQRQSGPEVQDDDHRHQRRAKLNEAIEWTIGDVAMGAEQHLKAGESNEFTIKGHMKESAGNEYMNESIDGIAITVAATQDTVENDSFGNTYDEDAEYPIVAMDTLQELINNATEPVSAKLEGNIAGSLTVPQDKEVTLDLNGFTLTGGDSHAILNHGTLCIKDSSGNGKIVASKANTSALRNAAVCVIDGGTFTRAAGVDNKWHTVENFGTMTFNGGKVIAEDGQSFAIVNGWNYIDPGEQKATMTINNIEMIAGPNGFKNCAGGTLTMNGGTLHCTGFWGLSNDSTGVATINGGKIISDKYVAISNGGAKMEINGGTFTGPQGSLYVQNYAHDTVVKGGSYANETVEFMRNYCPEGYTATLKDGMVVVSKD